MNPQSCCRLSYSLSFPLLSSPDGGQGALPSAPPFSLQLVCEDVNVDRFYPVLYPKVQLHLGPAPWAGWLTRELSIYAAPVVCRVFPPSSLTHST